MWANHVAEVYLLAELNQGMQGRQRWRDFLQNVSRRCGADETTLLFSDRATGEGSRRWSAVREDAIQYRCDETVATPLSFTKLRPNRVYSYAELAEPGDAQTQHVGLNRFSFGRVVRLGGPEDDSWLAWLLIERSAADFGAADSALLSALAPHAATAMANFAALERQSRRAETAEALLARAGIVWRLLDSDATPSAVLENWSTTMPREADRAVAQLAEHAATDTLLSPHAMRAGGTAQADLLLAPLSGDRHSVGAGTVVLARVPVEPHLAQARCLEQLLGLSPSEARFALTVAHGKSLAEAAQALELTVETARNYSKRIYAKTGARGLADLTRLVLTSVAMLA